MPDPGNVQKIADFFNVEKSAVDPRFAQNSFSTDTPTWATKEDVIDIEKTLKLNTTTISYDGIELTEDEKEKVDAIIRSVLWDRLKDKKEG